VSRSACSSTMASRYPTVMEHGIDPARAHGMFADFMQDAPMVCHNMRYDWTRALEPEWARLGVPPAGRVGFCSMLLSRRVIHETRRHNLDTLKAHFRVQSGTSHHALADVDTVVRLFTDVIGPRLSAAGIDTLDEIRRFSRRTPIRTCLAEIKAAGTRSDAGTVKSAMKE